MSREGGQPGQQSAGPVTRANWQDAPYNRRSFLAVGDVLPTLRVARGDGPPTPLRPAATHPNLGAVEVTRVDGTVSTFGEVMAGSYTDAYVVLHAGLVAAEWYGARMRPSTTHLLMSVSKSVLGTVAGILVSQGRLEPARPVTDYVPELSGSGYAGARVRDVLDMRSGVRFREDYTDPEADVRVMERWLGWRPSSSADQPIGLYRYLQTLHQGRPHGGAFSYRSCESDVLGWVCERAAAAAMPDILSALLWAPMGAEHDADFTCDATGTAVHDGGLCATARDMARFGRLVLDGGTVPLPDPPAAGPASAGSAELGPASAGPGSAGPPRTRRVVPEEWLRAISTIDPDIRGAFAASPSDEGLPGGWYRNQFWVGPRAYGDVLLCLGIHGQMVYICRGTRTVAVKLSTWPQPQNVALLHDTLRAFESVGAHLATLRAQPAGSARPPVGTAVLGSSRRRSTPSGQPP